MSLAFSCLSFFAWLLVFVRAGAEPTRPPGGGELALEMEADADVIDAASEMNSLRGVPGAWLSDAILGCRDRMLATLGLGTALTGADALATGGLSVFGVFVIRIIEGPVRLRGEPAAVPVGVAGRDVEVAVRLTALGFFVVLSAPAEEGSRS